MTTRHRTILFGLAWSLLISLGWFSLWCYEHRPASLSAATRRWPAHTLLTRAENEPTLVMVAHPKCPCTRASMTELSVLMARCPHLKCYVLFLKPQGAAEDWAKTDIWQMASKIPSVTLISDSEGVEAAHFHATVSGQTLLYDQEGLLLFDGGITKFRGHAGDNFGLDKLQAAVQGKTRVLSKTFTYGCSLIDDSRLAQENFLCQQQ